MNAISMALLGIVLIAPQHAHKEVVADGIRVRVQEIAANPRSTFELLITKEGKEDVRVGIKSAVAGVADLHIHDGRTVSTVLMGYGTEKVLVVADTSTGEVLLERRCERLQVSSDRNAYRFSEAGGGSFTYFVTERALRRSMSAPAGILQAFSNGSIDSKIRMLKAYNQSAKLRESVEIANAVLLELQKEVAFDRARASQERTAVRRWSTRRDYLGELILAVSRLRSPAAIGTLAQADHLAAPHVLAAYGAPAVPELLRNIASAPPPGYSEYYRSGLLQALLETVKSSRLAALPPGIVNATAKVLTESRNWRELAAAIQLAALIDDDRLDARLEALAYGPVQLESRQGEVDPRHIAAVRDAASRALTLVLQAPPANRSRK